VTVAHNGGIAQGRNGNNGAQLLAATVDASLFLCRLRVFACPILTLLFARSPLSGAGGAPLAPLAVREIGGNVAASGIRVGRACGRHKLIWPVAEGARGAVAVGSRGAWRRGVRHTGFTDGTGGAHGVAVGGACGVGVLARAADPAGTARSVGGSRQGDSLELPTPTCSAVEADAVGGGSWGNVFKLVSATLGDGSANAVGVRAGRCDFIPANSEQREESRYRVHRC